MPETKPKQTTSKRWICKTGNFNDQVIQDVTFLVTSCRSRLQPLSSGGSRCHSPSQIWSVTWPWITLVCGVLTKKMPALRMLLFMYQALIYFFKKVRKAVPPKGMKRWRFAKPKHGWFQPYLDRSLAFMGGDLTYPKWLSLLQLHRIGILLETPRN